MHSNEELVNYLIGTGVLKSLNIIRAMSKIDRKDFVPEECLSFAYDDNAMSIGYGQTISQPSTVAFMLEELKPKENDKILDIGYGSGWTTAILGTIAGSGGKVFAFEMIPSLKRFGEKNIKKYKLDNVSLFEGDASEGYSKEAPYDRILCSAAADSVPGALKEQLKIQGRLVIPVGKLSQSIYVIERLDEEVFKTKKYPGFIFVELKGRHEKKY